MNKLPLGQTIAFGYAFLVTEFSTIVRVCWIPSLLIVASDYLLRRYTFFYSGGNAETSSALSDFVVLSAALSLWLFSSSVMAVGITRLAMGLELDKGKIYFPLGRTELRMFTANIRYVLSVAVLIVLAALVSALVLYLAGVEFGQAEAQEAAPAALFASFVVFLLFGYVLVSAVRLAFFLPAIVVAEDKGLERAHSAAAGNVWRILAVLVGIAAPLVVIGTLCEAAILIAAFGGDVLAGDPGAIFENLEEAAAARPLAWAAYRFSFNIALMGIVPSTAAFAYLKVTEGVQGKPGGVTPPPRVPPLV
jgi:hypothetical protein